MLLAALVQEQWDTMEALRESQEHYAEVSRQRARAEARRRGDLGLISLDERGRLVRGSVWIYT